MFPYMLLPGTAEVELVHLQADASAISITLHRIQPSAPRLSKTGGGGSRLNHPDRAMLSSLLVICQRMSSNWDKTRD